MKILFVVSVLKGIGGIESSLINLLNNLKDTQHELSICVIGDYISPSTEIPSNVKVIKGNKIIKYCCVEYKDLSMSLSRIELLGAAFIKILKRLIGFRPILLTCLKVMKNSEKYDIAISYSNDMYRDVYSGGCEDYVEKCIKAEKKIAWIHNDAREHGLTQSICKRKYNKFKYVVNVSQACKKIFDEIIPKYEYKSKVITNTLYFEDISRKKRDASPFSDNKFNLVTVARVENQQKRIDRILECCKLLKIKGLKNWKWTVVGDGPDLLNLKQKAVDMGIDDVLEFVGRKSNPIPFMQHANIFVQTSDYEAYSMVLIESLYVSTPCLVTNYDSASNIIRNNYNGWIVEKSIDELVDKITYLSSNPEILNTVGENCIKSSRELNKKALSSFYNLLS
ncbi:glycosyltransferase [Priestia megaterium]|uniref:glycosyltransferase n=1 Tax=Priestia megaterium TaxID=1404 RepID=UPI002449C868|nr:glycosyltransferase [Priestia megaterium]MDH2362479.1 glycosyltransferase [Priestia megaterium]